MNYSLGRDALSLGKKGNDPPIVYASAPSSLSWRVPRLIQRRDVVPRDDVPSPATSSLPRDERGVRNVVESAFAFAGIIGRHERRFGAFNNETGFGDEHQLVIAFLNML